MPNVETRGTGVTASSIITFDLDDATDRDLIRVMPNGSWLDRYLNEREAYAKSVLCKAGLPSECGYYQLTGTGWRGSRLGGG